MKDYHLALGVLTLGVLALDDVLLENQLLRLIKQKKSIFFKNLNIEATVRSIVLKTRDPCIVHNFYEDMRLKLFLFKKKLQAM